MMRLTELKQALAQFGASKNVTITHDFSHKETGNYGVWYPVRRKSLHADDIPVETADIVSVQLWLREEYSELPDQLEAFFRSLDLAYDMQTYADYEEEVSRYHYGWLVEIA
jgi:hypothetical protein